MLWAGSLLSRVINWEGIFAMTDFWNKFTEKTGAPPLGRSLLVIVLVVYEARSLMNTILLTFIFTLLNRPLGTTWSNVRSPGVPGSPWWSC